MKKILLLPILAIFFATGANAFAGNFFKQLADPVVKPVTKATKWVGKQSGVTPTMDNANGAAKSAQQAADDAHKAIVEMKPKAEGALDSVKNTSDTAGAILQWIKWPIVIATYSCALWLLGVAIRSWLPSARAVDTRHRPAPSEEFIKEIPRRALTPLRRFFLLTVGSILFFAVIGALLLLAGISFQNITPLLIVAGTASIITGVVFFWIPFKQTKICVALGFIGSIAILWVAALALP